MSKSKSKPILSVIITAHHEGIIAHKTMLSVFRALESFDKSGLTYEIIIHIDNGDESTENYFQRYENDPRFKILRNNFGNPAESRNFAINQAHSIYAAIIDGDDMISRNWFIDGYKMLKDSPEPVILRPNFQVQFGGGDPHHNVWVIDNSFSKDEDALIMTYYNKWPNTLLSTTQLLKSIPFKPTVNGFGFEDWLFNCDVRAANIPNMVVPDSTLFYRRRHNSVTSEHMGTVLPYSQLFDIDYIKSISMSPSTYRPESTTSKLKKGGKKAIVQTIKQVPLLRRLALPYAQRVFYKKQANRLPLGLIDSWKDINSIDHQLYPTVETIVGVRFHPLSFNQHNTAFGNIYKKLLEQVTKKPDYLFLVPPLAVTGGTEKLLFNYISAIAKAHPDWHFAVLSALPPNPPYTVPTNTDFIDFDGLTKSLEWYERDVIWSRLLIQLQVKRLHIINHEGWYRWATAHSNLLAKNGFILNLSMFMREYTEEPGRIRSFTDPFLNDVYPVINKVFTDNQNVIDEILATNAFDPKKFIVHYQPVSPDMTEPKEIKVTNDRPLRILWASRLSYQKRPDLVKKIAEKLDPSKFHIDVYGREQHYTKNYFAGLQGLTYKGSFNGIGSIPTSDYDIYLYTSSVDGVPNILLEVAASGLPIVASNDGGVGEFIIDRKTGYLVEIEDINGYLDALSHIRSQPREAKAMALAAQELLASQHSLTKFEAEVARDIN